MCLLFVYGLVSSDAAGASVTNKLLQIGRLQNQHSILISNLKGCEIS
jgi:hypothetical protein